MVETYDPELVKVARIGLADEFTDHTVYQKLSEKVDSGSTFGIALGELSRTEEKHLHFWQKYVPDEKPRYRGWLIRWILILYRIFGITFTVRYLERHETNAIKQYKSVARLIPEADRPAFDEMLADEVSHEKDFSHRLESAAIQYISFVVLGLADALVEITGIHAGSLGIYNKTEIAGLAGIVAGAAASLAMASAAFAQAKQGFKGSARLSAIYTGVSYFITAILLATPYFLTGSMLVALFASLTMAVVIITFTTYYSSVIAGKPFTKDFLEILLIMLGVTVALYVFGYFIRVWTGITIG